MPEPTTDAKAAVLTEGKLLPTTLRFGLPLALGMAAHGLFNCVDLVIVGRLGEGAVAAVTIGGIINMVAMLAFNGVANVLAGFASSLRGQGDAPRFAALQRLSLRLTIAASLVLGLGFAALASPMIGLIGYDAATHALSTEYLVICSLGSGTMFFVLWGTSILRAEGESFWPTTVLIGSNALNLGLDFLLVFGLWGFPKLGVAGAAWATVISRLIGAVLLVVVIQRRPESKSEPGDARGFLPELLWKGLTNSAQTIARVLGLYALLAAAARTLDDPSRYAARDFLDGVGVAIRLEMVLMFAALGVGGAAASFVGQNLGARRFPRLQKGLLYFVVEAMLIGSFFALLLWSFNASIFRFTAPDAADSAARHAETYLAAILPVQPALVIAIVISQALVGIGSVRTAVIVDALLYLGMAPLVVLYLDGDAHTSFVTLAATHVLAAAAYLLVARRRFAARSLGRSPGAGD